MSNNYSDLRQTLIQLRSQQDYNDMRRGALLMRGRLFTWLNIYRNQLRELGRKTPVHIAAYAALENEPDLMPLLVQWAEEDNIQLSLPCMVDDQSPLVFRPWSLDTPMKTAAFGVQEPDTNDVAPNPEIILVPTLGFSRTGDRLGYGKGYYDRTLAHLKNQNHEAVTIGIAWAVGDLSSYNYTPADHDQPLHSVLTDKGWAVPAPTASL